MQLHGAQSITRCDILLGLKLSERVPPYFDGLIAAFEAGYVGRFVHLGAWDEPPTPLELAQPDAFQQAQVSLNARLLELADLADGQRVLDVGCGFGGTLEVVDQRHQRMALVGLNVDPRQLAICRHLRPRQGNTLRWVQADAGALPLAGASIDRLLCVEAMFHFDSRRQFFREAARVLAPGGVMAVSDILLRPGVDGVPGADAALMQTVHQGFGPWPDFWGSDADLAALATAAGLVCTYYRDLADATLPSHLFTAPAGVPPRDPIGRASAALAMLHRAGRLSYVFARFERPRG